MFSKDPVRNSKDKTLVEATIVGIYKGKTVQKSNYPYEMLENTAFSDTQLIKDLYGYSKGKAFYLQTTVYPKKNADIETLKSFIKKQSY